MGMINNLNHRNMLIFITALSLNIYNNNIIFYFLNLISNNTYKI